MPGYLEHIHVNDNRQIYGKSPVIDTVDIDGNITLGIPYFPVILHFDQSMTNPALGQNAKTISGSSYYMYVYAQGNDPTQAGEAYGGDLILSAGEGGIHEGIRYNSGIVSLQSTVNYTPFSFLNFFKVLNSSELGIPRVSYADHQGYVNDLPSGISLASTVQNRSSDAIVELSSLPYGFPDNTHPDPSLISTFKWFRTTTTSTTPFVIPISTNLPILNHSDSILSNLVVGGNYKVTCELVGAAGTAYSCTAKYVAEFYWGGIYGTTFTGAMTSEYTVNMGSTTVTWRDPQSLVHPLSAGIVVTPQNSTLTVWTAKITIQVSGAVNFKSVGWGLSAGMSSALGVGAELGKEVGSSHGTSTASGVGAYWIPTIIIVGVGSTRAYGTTNGGETWFPGGDLTGFRYGSWAIVYDPDHGRLVSIDHSGIGNSVSSANDRLTWVIGGGLAIGDWGKLVYDPDHHRLIEITNLLSSPNNLSNDGGQTWLMGGFIDLIRQYSDLVHDPDHHRLVMISPDSKITNYSTDGSQTWISGGNLTAEAVWSKVVHDPDHHRLVAITGNVSGTCITNYSTDGSQTWISGGNLTAFSGWSKVVHDPDHHRLVAIALTNGGTTTRITNLSTDGGQTWISGGNLTISAIWSELVYDPVHQRLIAISDDTVTNYSNDGGQTWIRGGDLPPGHYSWYSAAYIPLSGP